MRVRVIFGLKNRGGFVPFHHQYLTTRLFKTVMMKGGDESYLNFDYFNFSGLKGLTKLSRKGLHYYSSKITVVVSSMSKDFLDYLLKNIFSIPSLEIGGLKLTPDHVELEHEPELKDETAFICLSPIVLFTPRPYDESSIRFIEPETDEFSDMLYESTLSRMIKMGTYSPSELESFNKFQIEPDSKYLDKIRSSNKKFARVYSVYDQDVKFEVRGYTMPFILYAQPEVREFVFNCGLGAIGQKGFGMVDVVHGNNLTTTEQYEV